MLLEVHVDVLYIYFKDESLGIIEGFTVNNLPLYICILVISVVGTGQDFFFSILGLHPTTDVSVVLKSTYVEAKFLRGGICP